MKKVVSLLLVMVMLVSFAACNTTKPVETTGNNNAVDTNPTDTKPVETTPPEPVKITLYPLNGNSMSGVVGGWIGEYLADHGIILEILAYSDEKLNAILQGGDLPDIMYMQTPSDPEALVASGLFMDMEQYLDKLPNLTSNEMYQTALNYSKEFVSKGPLMFLPQNVGPAAPAITDRTTIKLDWEAYEKIGAPEFETLDELIPILKKMQEATPQAPDGSKTYAHMAYSSSDGNYLYILQDLFYPLGCGTGQLAYGIETDYVKEEWRYCYDDNSTLKYALQWLNKLNREGLMDPDSVTADRSSQNKRIEAGQGLSAYCGLPGYEQFGFYPVYFNDLVLATTSGYPYGGGSYVAVSAKTKELDTVLKFLNLSADPTFVRTMANGPQGELWDRDANNNLVITEKGKAAYLNGETVTINGENYVFFNTPWLIHPNTPDPIDGECVNVASSKTYVLLSSQTDGQAAWAEHYGYSDFITMMEDKGQKILRFDDNVTKFAEPISEELKMLVAACKEFVVPECWKLVYAKSDAEFEQLWDNLVKGVEEMGMKDLYTWRMQNLKDAKAIRDSLAG